jgi:hypothetical protein
MRLARKMPGRIGMIPAVMQVMWLARKMLVRMQM